METSLTGSPKPQTDVTALAFSRGEDLPARSELLASRTSLRAGSEVKLDFRPILGEWYNCDEGESGGILRIELMENRGVLQVRAYGANGFGSEAAEPNDWGAIDAVPFAPDVSSREAWAFTATYDFSFLETLIVAYVKLGVLVTTTYNTFRDQSGRTDYWTREFFHLQEQEVAHATHHARP
ncbi:hypothetical protein LZC95_05665 [Pendulispora brunnea]|uniref:Uncharacterized protein n=1 Tax=Pendulispora brunnea TaxID=2905690 RepID=A0ABZ2KG86_9BACT